MKLPMMSMNARVAVAGTPYGMIPSVQINIETLTGFLKKSEIFCPVVRVSRSKLDSFNSSLADNPL